MQSIDINLPDTEKGDREYSLGEEEGRRGRKGAEEAAFSLFFRLVIPTVMELNG